MPEFGEGLFFTIKIVLKEPGFFELFINLPVYLNG
jgi:hypothetical protein